MKKIILFVLVVACLISPVMGETGTLNYDYEDYAGYTSQVTGTISDSFKTGEWVGNQIKFEAIENYPSVSHMVFFVTGLNRIDYADNYTKSSGESAFTSTYGDGTYYWYRDIINGTSTKLTVVLEFDTWDIGSASGLQYCSPTLAQPAEGIEAYVLGGTPVRTSDLSYVFLTRMTGEYKQISEIYQSVEFHQSLDYETDAENRLIDLNFTRNGYGNFIVITDQTDEIRFSESSSSDRTVLLNDVDRVHITLTNPVKPSSPFTSDIYITEPEEEPGEDPDIPETDPTKFKGYIYDAQTGNLIGGSVLNVIENMTADDPYLLNVTNKDGVSEYTFEWADDVDWLNFTASAIGYNPSTEYFNHSVTTAPPGSTVDMSFHLVSDGSLGTGAYALSFLVYQSVSSESALVVKSSDATVICDGEQHLTGLSGGTWFNVTAGDHTYIISKNGFETLQGTVSIDSNYLKTVTLELGPDTPTVDDPTGNETGEVGDETMHEAVAEAYAQFGAFVPEAVMIACVLFLLSMFKKF